MERPIICRDWYTRIIHTTVIIGFVSNSVAMNIIRKSDSGTINVRFKEENNEQREAGTE